MQVRLKSARYLGGFPRVTTDDFVLYGQDGGQSIDLQDDRVLFLFADTLLLARNPQLAARAATTDHGPPRPHTGAAEVFLPNCAALAPRKPYLESLAQLKYITDSYGLPRTIIQAEAREQFKKIRFWPEHGLRIGDSVYIYYIGVQTIDPTSSWGFRGVGAGLARLDLSDLSVTRLKRRGNWRFWGDEDNDLHFGVCVRRHDDYAYVYFTSGEKLYMTARLARVPIEHIENADAYEYLSSTKPTWSSELDDAVSLGGCAPELTVNYNRYLDKYVMFCVDGFTKALNLRLADHPWGPFGPVQPLIRVPCDPKTPLIYLGFEQSIFEEDEGRKIYLSYCHPEFSMNSSVVLKLA